MVGNYNKLFRECLFGFVISEKLKITRTAIILKGIDLFKKELDK